MTLSQEESALAVRALRSWAEQISMMESMLATHALGVPGLPAKVLEVNTEIHDLRLRATDLADRMEQQAGGGRKAAPTTAVEQLVARCRLWSELRVGEALALDDAHEIMAECYVTLGALVQERDRLARGECICAGCGLRQPGVGQGDPGF